MSRSNSGIPLPTQCNPCQIQPGNFTLRYQVVDDMFTDTGLVHLRLNLGEQAFNITVSAVIPGRAIFPFYRMEFAHERATNLFGVLSSADEAHNPHYHYFRREYEYNEFNYMGFYSLLSYNGELDIYVSENWDGAQVTETTYYAFALPLGVFRQVTGSAERHEWDMMMVRPYSGAWGIEENNHGGMFLINRSIKVWEYSRRMG